MIIEGVEVDQKLIDGCLQRMQIGPFTSKDIEMRARDLIRDQGYTYVCPMRLADRLIQHERKAWHIRLEPGRVWTWVAK